MAEDLAAEATEAAEVTEAEGKVADTAYGSTSRSSCSGSGPRCAHQAERAPLISQGCSVAAKGVRGTHAVGFFLGDVDGIVVMPV